MRTIRSAYSVLSLALCVTGSFAAAADRMEPRVPGFQRFYAAELPKLADEDEEPVKLDPVTGGRILLSELSCLSCHAASDELQAALSPKKAPVLDDVGSRVKADWIRSYLADPQATKPGTTMPNLIATLPESKRAAAVESLTHFLASTGTFVETRADTALISQGQAVFHKVGCLACHNKVDDNSPDIATSSPLPAVGKKYSINSLMAFLKDPLKARPSGRMPTRCR